MKQYNDGDWVGLIADYKHNVMLVHCITLAGGARGNCLTKKIKEVRGKNNVFNFRVLCSTLYLYLGRVLWASAAQLMSQQWCESNESTVYTNIS